MGGTAYQRATAGLGALVLLLAGCSGPSPEQEAVERAWNDHADEAVGDLVHPSHGLRNEHGAYFVSSSCGVSAPDGGETLYGCVLLFEDGTAWGGVVGVDGEGRAEIAAHLETVAR